MFRTCIHYKYFLLVAVLLYSFMLHELRAQEFSKKHSDFDIASVSEDMNFLLNRIEQIHPNPFRLVSQHEWKTLKDSIVASAPMDYAEFYAKVLQFISMARDGHTDAYPASGFSSIRASLPFKLVLFPDGVHILAITPKFKSFLGGKIEKIEGVPIAQVLAIVREIVPSDNEWGKKELLEDYIRMPRVLNALGITNNEDGFQFMYRKDGDLLRGSIQLTDLIDELPVGPPRRPVPEGWSDIRLSNKTEIPIWQQNVGKYYWYKKLERMDALYIQINRVLEPNSGDLLKFVESLPKPSESELTRLIIDLRTNRGGDATILQPLLHSIIRHWNYLEPGKIFVLISNYTFSAAVHLAAELESNTHAIFVGSPTAAPPNHYADVKRIALPNSGIEVEISSLYWQKSDPRDQRYAIYPDIEVEITGSDFIQNKDPVLDSVSNINPDSPKLNRNNFPVFNWFRESQKKQ